MLSVRSHCWERCLCQLSKPPLLLTIQQCHKGTVCKACMLTCLQIQGRSPLSSFAATNSPGAYSTTMEASDDGLRVPRKSRVDKSDCMQYSYYTFPISSGSLQLTQPHAVPGKYHQPGVEEVEDESRARPSARGAVRISVNPFKEAAQEERENGQQNGPFNLDSDDEGPPSPPCLSLPRWPPDCTQPAKYAA